MSAFALPPPDITMNGGTTTNADAESLPTVVIGSMDRFQEYQTILTAMRQREGTEKVRGEMVDRILENATQLPTKLHQMHLVISTAKSLAFLPSVPSHTLVHFHLDASESSSSAEPAFLSNLQSQGWQRVAVGVEGSSSGEIVSYTSPQQSNSTSTPAVGGTVKLKKRTSKAQKSSIWAAASPMIEEPEKLLTAEDKKRPECVFPDPADGQRKRRKRACKDCTCGLKELEDEEENATTSQAFYIEGEDDIPDHIKTATAGVEKIWPKTEKLQQAVKTSSCGSCYAGDAFRCGSCPYLGMPAFEPGQKVEIPVGMTDL